MKRQSDIGHDAALERMRSWDRCLGEITNLFIRRYLTVTPLDYIKIQGASDNEIGVGVFFKTDLDLKRSHEIGLCDEMISFIYDKLEVWGRGSRTELTVEFEFDSFENVQKNFEGSYFMRLR
jgi:hypothetical protein